MNNGEPSLIEPGVHYFFRERLKNCHVKRTTYNDTLIKTKEFKKAFLFKTYENEKSINNILIPNEKVLKKVDFYEFNKFIENNLANDLSEINELKKYHKKEIINFIKNKNNNVVFLRRK